LVVVAEAAIHKIQKTAITPSSIAIMLTMWPLRMILIARRGGRVRRVKSAITRVTTLAALTMPSWLSTLAMCASIPSMKSEKREMMLNITIRMIRAMDDHDDIADYSVAETTIGRNTGKRG